MDTGFYTSIQTQRWLQANHVDINSRDLKEKNPKWGGKDNLGSGFSSPEESSDWWGGFEEEAKSAREGETAADIVNRWRNQQGSKNSDEN